jgi:hypothetical protein
MGIFSDRNRRKYNLNELISRGAPYVSAALGPARPGGEPTTETATKLIEQTYAEAAAMVSQRRQDGATGCAAIGVVFGVAGSVAGILGDAAVAITCGTQIVVFGVLSAKFHYDAYRLTKPSSLSNRAARGDKWVYEETEERLNTKIKERLRPSVPAVG